MTTLRHNFDGGPDGTTITVANSGQVDGNDPFDGVVNTSCTLQYEQQFGRPTAEFVMLADTGATAAAPCVFWNTSMGAQSEIWTRFYAYYDASPVVSSSPLLFGCSGLGNTVGCVFVGLRVTTQRIFISDGATSSFITTTDPVPIQSWFRIEVRAQFSTTTGNVELRYFDEADSDEPTESISASSWNLGTSTADGYYYGYAKSISNLTPLYMSGLELNNTDWPGPAPFKVKGVPGIQPSPQAIHNW